MASLWKIVSYIVAGDPTLAQIFFNWLVVADQGISVDDYRWPSKVIELKGHTVSNQTVKVNTRECLDYLMGAAEPKKILAGPLIRNHKDLWWKATSAAAPVDLFDASTWPNRIDFTPLCDIVHALIATHMCQNQRIESYSWIAYELQVGTFQF